jgi:hypothetical protein
MQPELPQPLMPHHPTSTWRQRFSHASRGTQIAIGFGVLLASCVICSCLGIGILAGIGSLLPSSAFVTQQAGNSSVQPTTRPTTSMTSHLTPSPHPTATATTPSQPTATPTPLPPMVTGATQGGPVDAFVAKYGGDGALYDIDGVTFSLNTDAAADGKQHVFEMLVYKSDATTWTLSEARSVCRAFLPSDATYHRQTTNKEHDTEDIFSSTRLAHTFASSSPWYDPTGTVTITYVVRNGGVFQCEIEPYV